MPTVTVKLSDSDYELLEELRQSESGTKSKSDVIRFLLHQREGVLPDSPSCSDDVLAILKEQLTVKDKQIADLNAALLAAQETAKAAQLLQAAEKPEKLLQQTNERPSWWQRFKSALS